MMECHKIKFASRAEAGAYARRVAADNGTGRLRPYKCDAGCAEDTWHLTSQSSSEARRVRKRRNHSRGEGQ